MSDDYGSLIGSFTKWLDESKALVVDGDDSFDQLMKCSRDSNLDVDGEDDYSDEDGMVDVVLDTSLKFSHFSQFSYPAAGEDL